MGSADKRGMVMRDYRFGNFLRTLRERRGLSQYQLGMLAGVSDKAVSKWENGLAKPQSRILHRLSEVLGVTVDELLACRYYSPDIGNKESTFVEKKELWERVYQDLEHLYGTIPPVEVISRYLEEFAQLQSTDWIVYFDFLRQARTWAKECGGQICVPGSIEASFVAYVMGATEINPLKPHYYCPACHRIEFVKDVLSGWDLPIRRCSCGKEFLRDGHDLPFETLNSILRKNIRLDIFVSEGSQRAVRRMLRAYFADKIVVTLKDGEHPEKETLVIIDNENREMQCYNGQELSFAAYYGRLKRNPVITLTGSGRIDKYHCLEEETKSFFEEVPFTDSRVLEAFLKKDTQGIPEFGNEFAQKLIGETAAGTFHDLVQTAGLCHGTGVWEENARELIKNGMPVGKVIAYRDDVFRYVRQRMEEKGISGTGYAYRIMEDVRRGIYAKRGVPEAVRQQLLEIDGEEWFVESIGKIEYLFPKAHGVLSVKYALILMWYKVNYPELFARIMLSG